jgi:sec-independent protein translocase protein TatB
MFEVGFFEIVLIFGLALVVLGPEKLPKLASTVGRWVGRARAMARQFQDQLETEAESIKSSVGDMKSDIQSTVSDLKSTVTELQSQVSELNHSVADVKQEVEAAVTPSPVTTPPEEAGTSSANVTIEKPDVRYP